MPRDPRDRFAQMDAIRAALRWGETPSVSLPDDAMRPPEPQPTPAIRGRESTPDPRPMELRGRSYNQTIMDELMNSVVLDESVADGHLRMMNSMGRVVAGTVGGAAGAGFAQMNAAAQQMLHNNQAQDQLRQRMEQDMELVEREYRRALERQLMQDNNSQALPPGLLGIQPLSREEVERRYPRREVAGTVIPPADVELQRQLQRTLDEANRNARQSVHRRPGMQRLEPWNGANALTFGTRLHDDVVDSMQLGRGSDPPEAFIDIEPPEEPNAPSA